MLDARVVIVNHRSGDRLERLLDALAPEVREIVVVDNASDDGSPERAEAIAARKGDGRASIRIVRNASNDGFSAAANDGARDATTPWLVFANPDVHPAPGDLDRLLNTSPGEILAPVQTDRDGNLRPESAGYDLTLGRMIVWALLPSRQHGTRGPWLTPPPAAGDEAVDWVSGALMAVATERFRTLGGFDERYFLYLEDADLCRRAREAGARVVLRADLRVFHEVADGDPARRSDAAARWVAALGISTTGSRRRLLGAILALGFGLRVLAGRPGSSAAFSRALSLIVGRW